MNLIAELQAWYEKQCDGDWEHGLGITIETLDNPGWSVKINLQGTNLENEPFQEMTDIEPEDAWIRCWVEDGMFHGVGGPRQLEAILQIFLNWAKDA